MLSQILPGLRDFRTPFASGVLWLLFAWLLIEPHVDRSHPEGVYASIRDLNEALKPLGVGAGLTLVAYLAGAITEVLWSIPLQRLSGVSRGGMRAISTAVHRRLDELSDEETVVFGLCHSYSARHVMSMFDRSSTPPSPSHLGRYMVDDPGGQPEIAAVRAMASTAHVVRRVAAALAYDLTRAVRNELDVTATRLLTEEKTKQQFDIYDRLRSEAEFRIAIAAPLAGLLYVVLHPPAGKVLAGAAALTVGVLFLLQARSRRLAAGDRVADALLLKDVEAPSLEQTQARSYTVDSLEAGEVRMPREASVESEGLGVPWHRVVRRTIGNAVEAVVDVLAPLASRLWSGIVFVVLLFPRADRAAWNALRGGVFLVRDHLFNAGRVAKQMRQLRPAIKRQEPSARIALGDAYRSSSYLRRARREYRAANANFRLAELDLEREWRRLIRRGYVDVLPDLVDLYAAQDRLEDARLACIYAVALGHAAARIPLGDVLRALDRPSEAAAEYHAAAEAGKATALTRLGEMRVKEGRFEEAETHLREALSRGAKSASGPLRELYRRQERSVDGLQSLSVEDHETQPSAPDSTPGETAIGNEEGVVSTVAISGEEHGRNSQSSSPGRPASRPWTQRLARHLFRRKSDRGKSAQRAHD